MRFDAAGTLLAEVRQSLRWTCGERLAARRGRAGLAGTAGRGGTVACRRRCDLRRRSCRLAGAWFPPDRPIRRRRGLGGEPFAPDPLRDGDDDLAGRRARRDEQVRIRRRRPPARRGDQRARSRGAGHLRSCLAADRGTNGRQRRADAVLRRSPRPRQDLVRPGDSDAFPTVRYERRDDVLPLSVRTGSGAAPIPPTPTRRRSISTVCREIQARSRVDGEDVRVTGVVGYNRKGDVVGKGTPLLRKGLDFETPETLPPTPVFRYRHDSLGRVIVALNLEGREMRVRYTPWSATTAHVIDTIHRIRTGTRRRSSTSMPSVGLSGSR